LFAGAASAAASSMSDVFGRAGACWVVTFSSYTWELDRSVQRRASSEVCRVYSKSVWNLTSPCLTRYEVDGALKPGNLQVLTEAMAWPFTVPSSRWLLARTSIEASVPLPPVCG
jgi:hypothetical protein